MYACTDWEAAVFECDQLCRDFRIYAYYGIQSDVSGGRRRCLCGGSFGSYGAFPPAVSQPIVDRGGCGVDGQSLLANRVFRIDGVESLWAPGQPSGEG
jgi:hypothetical protein